MFQSGIFVVRLSIFFIVCSNVFVGNFWQYVVEHWGGPVLFIVFDFLASIHHESLLLSNLIAKVEIDFVIGAEPLMSYQLFFHLKLKE